MRVAGEADPSRGNISRFSRTAGQVNGAPIINEKILVGLKSFDFLFLCKNPLATAEVESEDLHSLKEVWPTPPSI